MPVRNDEPLTEDQRGFVTRNYKFAMMKANEHIFKHPHNDPDEIISLAELALIRASRTYDPAKGAPTTYIGRAIYLAFLNHFTDNYNTEPPLSLDTLMVDGEDRGLHEILPSGETPVPDQYERMEAVEIIREAISLLDPRDREIIELTFIQGLTDVAASDLLVSTKLKGTTIGRGGAQRRRYAALEKLKDILFVMGITKTCHLFPDSTV